MGGDREGRRGSHGGCATGTLPAGSESYSLQDRTRWRQARTRARARRRASALTDDRAGRIASGRGPSLSGSRRTLPHPRPGIVHPPHDSRPRLGRAEGKRFEWFYRICSVATLLAANIVYQGSSLEATVIPNGSLPLTALASVITPALSILAMLPLVT